MALANKDTLDRAIVKAYINVKTVNLETRKTLAPEEVLNAMAAYASLNMAFVNFAK